VNNSFPAPAVVKQASAEVNLHTSADIDFYQFTIPNNVDGAFRYFTAGIENSDYPVSLTLLDSVGATVQTASATTFHQDFGGPMDQGKTYTLAVNGPRTRYQLEIGIRVKNPPQFVAYDPWYWMDPIGPDPFRGIFHGPEEWIQVDVSGQESRFNLNGLGLKISAYDANGALVAAGQDIGYRDQVYGQTLDIAGKTVPGQSLFLKLERKSLGFETALGEAALLDVGNAGTEFILIGL
jgi:hypothetical protein